MARHASLAMTALVLYAVFTMTAHSGAAVAQDDTVDFDEERDELVSNLTATQQNVTQNYTDTERDIFGPVLNATMEAAKLGTKHGMAFGRDNPSVALANVALAPWVLIGLVAFYIREMRKPPQQR